MTTSQTRMLAFVINAGQFSTTEASLALCDFPIVEQLTSGKSRLR